MGSAWEAVGVVSVSVAVAVELQPVIPKRPSPVAATPAPLRNCLLDESTTPLLFNFLDIFPPADCNLKNTFVTITLCLAQFTLFYKVAR